MGLQRFVQNIWNELLHMRRPIASTVECERGAIGVVARRRMIDHVAKSDSTLSLTRQAFTPTARIEESAIIPEECVVVPGSGLLHQLQILCVLSCEHSSGMESDDRAA
jgi:hypothetical protein